MSSAGSLPFDATLGEYERLAQVLFDSVQAGVEAAQWRFKWEHPRFKGKSVGDVAAAALEITDAQDVVAHEYGFHHWDDLARFTSAVRDNPSVARFEAAVEAVISGDVNALDAMLRDDPGLARARSMRRHRATLLHYVAANGVEGSRQKTPPNAVDVMKVLLDAGAEVDALAEMYGEKCTTMSMLVSSCHPAAVGLQAVLAETLVDYGAAIDGPGSKWQSAVMTALAFGYLDTARALAARSTPADNLAIMAGLGRVEDVARLLASADETSRHAAVALAAQHGHAAVLRLLLDAGEDPNRYNPDGFHSHSTPLHQAVWSGHGDVVRLLVERGARLDMRDTIYQGTPLGWANYGGRKEIAEYLRDRGAPA